MLAPAHPTLAAFGCFLRAGRLARSLFCLGADRFFRAALFLAARFFCFAGRSFLVVRLRGEAGIMPRASDASPGVTFATVSSALFRRLETLSNTTPAAAGPAAASPAVAASLATATPSLQPQGRFPDLPNKTFLSHHISPALIANPAGRLERAPQFAHHTGMSRVPKSKRPYVGGINAPTKLRA